MPGKRPTQFGDLLTIPGVGKAMAQDLLSLGYRFVDDLRGADPEDMYAQLCCLQRQKLDRCVLYVFRCAVYFAETAQPEVEKLKWWNWKD